MSQEHWQNIKDSGMYCPAPESDHEKFMGKIERTNSDQTHFKYNALWHNDLLTELKTHLSSEQFTIAEKQALIAKFEEIHVPKPAKKYVSVIDQADPTFQQAVIQQGQGKAELDQAYAQQMQAFEKHLNTVFGAPEGNTWQDTLAGITPVSKAVSAPQKTEKTRNDHVSVVSASNDSKPATQTAGVSAKTAEGRLMAVVTTPFVKAPDDKTPSAEELAKNLTRTMALISKPIAASRPSDYHLFNPADIASLDAVCNQIPIQSTGISRQDPTFAAIQTFPAKDGKFEVIAIGTAKTTIIAYEPNKALKPDGETEDHKFTTIIQTINAQESSDVVYAKADLTEGSIVLILTEDILNNLTMTQNPEFVPIKGYRMNGRSGHGINFAELMAQGFELPSNLNESTLMAAFANHAAKNSLAKKHEDEKSLSDQQDTKLSSFPEEGAIKPDNFFIMGMVLSNELKTDQRLSPANWTPIAVAGLGIGLGLKFFAPELFAAAMPYLSPIILGFVGIAGAALVAYVISTIKKDWDNQFKSRKAETVSDYFLGIGERVKDWLLNKHPIQLVTGVFATGVMFAFIGLGLWWAIDPVGLGMSAVGPFINAFFNLVAQVIAGGSPIGVDVGVGSLLNQVFTVLTAAFMSVVVLDGIRRLSTYLYETFADTRTPEMDKLMSQQDGGKGIGAVPTPPPLRRDPTFNSINFGATGARSENLAARQYCTLYPGVVRYSDNGTIKNHGGKMGPLNEQINVKVLQTNYYQNTPYYYMIKVDDDGKPQGENFWVYEHDKYKSNFRSTPAAFSRTALYKLKENSSYAHTDEPNLDIAADTEFTIQILKENDDGMYLAKVISSCGKDPAAGSEVLVSKNSIEEVISKVSFSKQ